MNRRVLAQLAVLSIGIIQSCSTADFFGFNDRIPGRGTNAQAPLPSDQADDGLQDLTVFVTVNVLAKPATTQQPPASRPPYDPSDDDPSQQDPGQTSQQKPVQTPTQMPNGPQQVEITLTANTAEDIKRIACPQRQLLRELLSSLREELPSWHTINIGLIPYAEEVLSDLIIEPVSIDEFSQQLDNDLICGQETGGVAQSALEEARSKLEGIKGEVRVFDLTIEGMSPAIVEKR